MLFGSSFVSATSIFVARQFSSEPNRTIKYNVKMRIANYARFHFFPSIFFLFTVNGDGHSIDWGPRLRYFSMVQTMNKFHFTKTVHLSTRALTWVVPERLLYSKTLATSPCRREKKTIEYTQIQWRWVLWTSVISLASPNHTNTRKLPICFAWMMWNPCILHRILHRVHLNMSST